jgi:glycogen debranching enzyme
MGQICSLLPPVRVGLACGRPIFIATLRAARLLAGCFVAHRSKTAAGILPLRFAHPAQIRSSATSQGLFYGEMRHLSRLTLRLEEGESQLLTSSVRLDNAVLSVDQTNRELQRAGQKILDPGELHLSRSIFVWLNSCYQHVEIHNYGGEAIAVELILEFEADFADIFEARGHRREKGGKLLEPRVIGSTVSLGVLHEARQSEMALLGEVPYRRYYAALHFACCGLF